jgi:type II pantothenate kinase
MRVGIDFGLTITDAVAVDGTSLTAHAALDRPGVASVDVLRHALHALAIDPGDVDVIAVTGGRSRELPASLDGVPLEFVDEPTAIGRGALARTGLDLALVVSCGTGTAMVAADGLQRRYSHVSGTPQGGGTLEGLAWLLLGLRGVDELAALAVRGDATAVDTTLGDVLGGGVGQLPPTATAVNLGRLATLTTDPAPEDLAAGLVTMVAQAIGLLALNVAKAEGLPAVICVGRLAEVAPMRSMIEAVFRVYGASPPHFPEGAAHSVAYGAALTAP